MPYKLGSTGFTLLILRNGKWVFYRSYASRAAAKEALTKLNRKHKKEIQLK